MRDRLGDRWGDVPVVLRGFDRELIAIGRAGSDELEHPPRRDTHLLAGDDAYLAGSYEELRRVLRREREGNPAA